MSAHAHMAEQARHLLTASRTLCDQCGTGSAVAMGRMVDLAVSDIAELDEHVDKDGVYTAPCGGNDIEWYVKRADAMRDSAHGMLEGRVPFRLTLDAQAALIAAAGMLQDLTKSLR